MAATAVCPDTPPDLIPGLLYPPEWHRQQEADERAWLDTFIRTQHLPTASRTSR